MYCSSSDEGKAGAIGVHFVRKARCQRYFVF